MTLNNLLTIGFIITLFTACGNNSNKTNPEADLEVVAITNEVMRVHDEAMENMGKLSSFQAKLEKKSIEAINLNTSNPEYLKELQNAIYAVKLSSKSMKDWMYAYQPPKNKTKKELLSYYTAEEIKIKQVALNIEQSIIGAEAVLSIEPQ